MLEGHNVVGRQKDPPEESVVCQKQPQVAWTLDLCVQKFPLGLVHYLFTQVRLSSYSALSILPSAESFFDQRSQNLT